MYRPAIKILFVVSLFFLLPQIAQAGFLDDIAYCTANGSCGFDDVAKGLNSFIRFLLGAMGVAALLYFVWGGVQWLVSGGSAEKVNNGKQIMVNTIFAVILAFGSYILVSFFINDVLNVREPFEIEEGEFSSCEGSAVGTSCGDNKQCAGGFVGDWASLNGQCLYICEIQSLIASGYVRIGKCVGDIPEGWEIVPGWNSSWCPASNTCVYSPLD